MTKEDYLAAKKAFEARTAFMRRTLEGASEVALSVEALLWLCAECMSQIDSLTARIAHLEVKQ